MLKRKQIREENQRLIQTFEKTPQSLSQEQLVKVSQLYYDMADNALNKEHVKKSRRTQIAALFTLNEDAVTEAAYLWRETNSAVRSYGFLSKSAEAIGMAGYPENAKKIYKNSSKIAQSAVEKLQKYGYLVKEPHEKYSANNRIVSILYNAAQFALKAGDQAEHDRLIFKQKMVHKDNETLSVEIEIGKLSHPIDTTKLSRLTNALRDIQRERSELILGKGA